MNFLLWLILVSSVHSSPAGNSRRRESSRSPPTRNRKALSDEDLLKALSILMSETEQDKPRSEISRRGRQEFEGEFSDEVEFTPIDEIGDERPLSDQGLEESDRQSFSRQEKCEVTGFEIRVTEECEEVTETECKPIMVKKIRTEIVEKCDTLLDKKICNVTYSGVPKQKCSPKTSKRCEVDFNIVEEKLYKEECKVNVQHICEEHIKVPIPYPVKELHPEKLEEYHHHNVAAEDTLIHHGPPNIGPTNYLTTTGSAGDTFIQHSPPSPYPEHQGPKNYLTTPVPAPRPSYVPQQYVLGGVLFSKLFQRQKRTAGRKEDDNSDRHLEGIIKQVLLEAMQWKEAMANATEMKEEGLLDDPINFPLHFQHHSPSHLPHHLAPKIPNPAQHSVTEDQNSVHDLDTELPKSIQNLDTELLNHFHQIVPEHLNSKLGHSVHYLLPHGHPVPEHPPIVTTHELPSEPGCRSLATKTCYKIPIVVSKKVPFETCRDVPDVECVTVLKNVPEIECTPEPYEECNDVAKDIPFLEPSEECEEIVFDDCLEVEEKIPVELCTRKRINENDIFLKKGKVFRKEGEKRRKKIGQRKPDKISEEDEGN